MRDAHVSQSVSQSVTTFLRLTMHPRLQSVARAVLPWLARLHPKNWRPDRLAYPQLWHCWPRGTGRRRRPRAHAVRVALCGRLTGHEISRTEWGYGGGKFVDRNCRWCDKTILVPKDEETPP